MKRPLLLHIPVLHQGYRDVLERFRNDCDTLLIMGTSLTDQVMEIAKQISRLDPQWVCGLLQGMYPNVRVCEQDDLKRLPVSGLVMVDDQVSRLVRDSYLGDTPVEFVSVFLQWDRNNVKTVQPAQYDCRVSEEEFDRQMMGVAYEEAGKSSDWWRHVGCLAVRDGSVVYATHNSILPNEHVNYAHSDPRCSLEAGRDTELSLAIHGEQDLVAWASQPALAGCWLYVTTFPCTLCAKLIARAGISRVYFREGWASLDSLSILNAFGVEIVRVG